MAATCFGSTHEAIASADAFLALSVASNAFNPVYGGTADQICPSIVAICPVSVVTWAA
jgi:hypothetical protein